MSQRGVVAIRNLEFEGRHGATAAERRTHRRFSVDVEVETDLTQAIARDRLGDTVDYHRICEIVESLGTGEPFHLIEALAGAILAELARAWPKHAFTVEVRKLNPPCPGNPQAASVRISAPR